MDSDIPFFENFENFYEAHGIKSSKYEDLYVDKLDKRWTYPLLEVPPFKHKFYAVKFFLKGKGILRIGEWQQEMQASSIFVSSPNQIVSCKMEEGEVLGYALAISDKFIERHLKLKHFISDFHYFQSDKSIPFVIAQEEMEDVLNVFDNIYKEYLSDEEDAVEMMASAIFILYLKIKRLYQKYVPQDFTLNKTDASLAGESLSSRFLTMLNNDFQKETTEVKDYNIAYFASHLAVHPNHLSSVLKKETGKSAQEHLHSKTVFNAKSLLLHTDLSIKEIAFKLNFKESAHFNNFFKKQTSVTPTEFRKNQIP